MIESEKAIKETMKAYVFRIGGRGPRNIHVKKNDRQIVLELRINKSPLELFILQSFEDSQNYLTDMYERIANVVAKGIITELKVNHQIEVQMISFDVDFNHDVYKFVFEEI